MSCDTNEGMVAAFSSDEQCIYIKFESYHKKDAREIQVTLQEVCGNSALSYSQVARWANQFNNGRESVKGNEGRDWKNFSKWRIFCG